VHGRSEAEITKIGLPWADLGHPLDPPLLAAHVPFTYSYPLLSYLP